MEIFRYEQQLCPCYTECQEFQKLVELKDSGLAVYCHRPRTEDIRKAEAVESAVNTSNDVFILYNKEKVKITSSELTSELEKENISCPRCRKTYEHAQKLLQEVKSIERKMLMGICDHCKKTQGSKNPLCACDKIVKKFISIKVEQNENTKKYFKTSFPIKKGHHGRDKMVNKENQKAYSDIQINLGLSSPASRHEPEIQQMFSHTHFKLEGKGLSKTNLKQGYVKQAVAFIQPIESVKTSPAHTPHESEHLNMITSDNSLVDSETTFMEISEGLKELPRASLKDYEQEEIFEDIPSMDAKEALKRRHDLSLRQMMRLKKDSGAPYSVSKIPDIYETPKIAPWAQKEPTSKDHVESKVDIKIPTLKHHRGRRDTRGLDDVSKVTFRSTRSSQAIYIEPKKVDTNYHDKMNQDFYDSEEGPKKTKKLEERFIADEELKLQRSVGKSSHKDKKPQQRVPQSKSVPIETVGNVLEHKDSFFFPKVMEMEEKKEKLEVSSSHLIKDTREKFHLQAENKKKTEEEERKKKFEQAQEKKLAQEERKLQAGEKKRQAIENQKKYEKEQRKLKEEQIENKEDQRKSEGEQKKNKAEQKKYKEDQKKNKEEQRKLETDQKKKEARQSKIAEQPVDKKKKQDDLRRDTSEQIILDSKVKGQISKSMVAKKDVISKPDHRDNTKNSDDKIPEIRNMINLSQKLKEIKQKIKEKTDEENLKTQLEYLRKEKAARKSTPPEKGKVTKKSLEAPDEIQVSLSKIQKSLRKETSGQQEILTIKIGKGKALESKPLKKQSSKALIDTSELQKLQAQHLKEKEEALTKKKQLEYEAAKEAKAKEDAERKAKNAKHERIKMQKVRSDENLKLVILKQAVTMGPCSIHPKVLTIHKCNHQHSGERSSYCQLCVNSELELEVLSLEKKPNLTTDKTDIIIGEKIFTYKPRLEKIQEPEDVPILFQKEFCVEPDQQPKPQIFPQDTKSEQKQILLTELDVEPGKGVIRYALSDRTFIDKGWTMLPTEKVVRKMNVYRMRPAHPEFDWFERNKDKQLMTYDSGERLAEFDDNGRGRWYYRNGRLALDYYDAKETNAHQRFVIYSSGEPDERGRTYPITILATFDYLGNGIVFDHAGKIRLKYNQTEGVVLDRGIGPISHWQWHSLNDPPVLQQVMIDTQMAVKDPDIIEIGLGAENTTQPDNEEMLAIEFENFIKAKSRKLSQKFKPFQIKMKALKINEHFSLKVLDQATVYLIFRDGSTNLKLNIGMILDHQEIVDTDTAEVGEVSNSLEKFPARTDSLAGLQRSVAHAQRYERQHVERERRLRPPEPCASADQLTAAISPPLRLPLRTIPMGFSSSTGYCSRKPTNNLYYDTRRRC